MSIHSVKDNGKTGARECVTHGMGRAQVFSIAVELLMAAEKMLSETTFARSEVVASPGQAPKLGRLPPTQGVIKNTLEVATARYENLRRRMHTLQRAQLMLEVVDDATARQLDIILALLETNGALPIHFAAIPQEAIQAMQEASSKGDTSATPGDGGKQVH